MIVDVVVVDSSSIELCSRRGLACEPAAAAAADDDAQHTTHQRRVVTCLRGAIAGYLTLTIHAAGTDDALLLVIVILIISRSRSSVYIYMYVGSTCTFVSSFGQLKYAWRERVREGRACVLEKGPASFAAKGICEAVSSPFVVQVL